MTLLSGVSSTNRRIHSQELHLFTDKFDFLDQPSNLVHSLADLYQG